MEEHKAGHSKKKKKAMFFDSPQKMLFGGIAAVVVLVLFVLIGSVTYGVRKGSESSFVVWGAGVFNVPIASINGENVSYKDYLIDRGALEVYNAQQSTSSSDEELSDRALSRLLINALTQDVADEEDIEVTDEDIEEATGTLISQFPTEEALDEEMMTNFGWEFDTFVERIVVPSIREQKLAEKFRDGNAEAEGGEPLVELKARHILFMVENEEEKESVKADAEAVLDRIKGGEDFATLAAEFGSDGTKDKGGDLGWFGRGAMVPPFEEAVFALEPGSLGEELVETQFGFHIVQVDEKREVQDFASYMDNLLSEATIQIHGVIHNPFEGLLAQ